MVETPIASRRPIPECCRADLDGAAIQYDTVEGTPRRSLFEASQRTCENMETLDLHCTPPLELSMVLSCTVGPQHRFTGRQIDPHICEHRTLLVFFWGVV